MSFWKRLFGGGEQGSVDPGMRREVTSVAPATGVEFDADVALGLKEDPALEAWKAQNEASAAKVAEAAAKVEAIRSGLASAESVVEVGEAGAEEAVLVEEDEDNAAGGESEKIPA